MQLNNGSKMKQTLAYIQYKANICILWSINYGNYNTYFRMRLGDFMGGKPLEGSKVCCHQY